MFMRCVFYFDIFLLIPQQFLIFFADSCISNDLFGLISNYFLYEFFVSQTNIITACRDFLYIRLSAGENEEKII